MSFRTKVKRIWGEASRVERILLFAAFGFRLLATLLTWYALEQGFAEKSFLTAIFISKLGAPLGLSVSLIGSLVLILFLWGLWVSSRRQPEAPSNFWSKLLRLLTLIWTYIAFFGFFAFAFTDFAHDLLMILYNWDSLLVVLNFLIDALPYCLLPLGVFVVVVAILEKRLK